MSPPSERTTAYHLSLAANSCSMGGEHDAPRRLDRREAVLAELHSVLRGVFPGRGHRAEVAIAARKVEVAERFSQPLLETSDDTRYRAVYAGVLAARDDSSAAVEAERAVVVVKLADAAARAYADHAAASSSASATGRNALSAGVGNWKLRDTPRSRSLLDRARRNAERVSRAGQYRRHDASTDSPQRRARSRRKVVVLGTGFAEWRWSSPYGVAMPRVTLVDRNNHHLFQPFLFQVATSISNLRRLPRPSARCLAGCPTSGWRCGRRSASDTARRVVVMKEGEDLARAPRSSQRERRRVISVERLNRRDTPWG